MCRHRHCLICFYVLFTGTILHMLMYIVALALCCICFRIIFTRWRYIMPRQPVIRLWHVFCLHLIFGMPLVFMLR